jgi:CRISPR system Cascade subunit CasD
MTLLLHLHGPMQSWGGAARFDQRSTALSPTKSGVVGLLAAADGRKRGTSVADIAALTMTVRVDDPGQLMRDYHTVGANHPKGRRPVKAESGKDHPDTIVTERYYLASAAFTVALEGDDSLLEKLDRSLRSPTWPVALGRRSCPPAEPYLLGVDERNASALLRDVLPVFRPDRSDNVVQILAEDPTGDRITFADQPTAVLGRWNTYTHRTVLSTHDAFPKDRFTVDHFALLATLRDPAGAAS